MATQKFTEEQAITIHKECVIAKYHWSVLEEHLDELLDCLEKELTIALDEKGMTGTSLYLSYESDDINSVLTLDVSCTRVTSENFYCYTPHKADNQPISILFDTEKRKLFIEEFVAYCEKSSKEQLSSHRDSDKENRYAEYLKLKKEFEPEGGE